MQSEKRNHWFANLATEIELLEYLTGWVMNTPYADELGNWLSKWERSFWQRFLTFGGDFELSKSSNMFKGGVGIRAISGPNADWF